MDGIELDRKVRLFLFTHFVENSQPPSLAETASHFGLSIQQAQESYTRLHDAHMIVLDPAMQNVRMAMPFSAVPTAYRVEGMRNSWWANCAWDALGISVALQEKVRIVSKCPDCREPISIEAPPAESFERFSEVVHFALPVKRWWDDIFFT